MKAVRAAAPRPGAMGTGGSSPGFRRRGAVVPALSVVPIMVGGRCDIRAASRALQTPEISATEAPDPDIFRNGKAFEGAPMRSTPRLFLQASLVTLGLAGALAVAAQTPAQKPAAPTPAAAPADKVVARADGGVTVTEGDLALAAEDPSLSLPGMTEAQKRDLLVSYMVDLKLGARAADAAKIAEAPEFARKLAYFRDKLLLDEYLEREVKKTVTPEAAKKLYEDTVKTVKPEEEVRARHILSENEDDAKKAAARVKGGEAFAKVAAELSNDPGSKGEGGDLGFFTKDRMVQPFAETAFKLAPGEVSEPVKSQFGWHVIKLEEKRVKSVPPFEEMKEQVEQYLTRKAQQDLVLKLRQNAKIERLDQPAEAKPGEAAPAPAAPKQ